MKQLLKLLTLSLLSILFISCKAKLMDTSDKIKVSTTIFPIYEWTHELSYPDNNVSDNLILSLVLKSGMDYHSYKPADVELNQISNADLFIFIGGETDNWAKEIAANPKNKNQIALNLTEVLQQSDEVSSKDNFSDEHIWLSVKNTKVICKAISEQLIKLKPEFKDTYEKRLYDYLLKLEILDSKYENDLATIKDKNIVICDRNPFTYLFNDYNIKYFSTFNGCSNNTTISETDIKELINKINEFNSKAVIVTESSDKKTAKNIILNSNNAFGDVYSLDSFQTTTLRDAFNGKTYIKTMEKNLVELRRTLE